jgi:hypothetical protein
MKQYNALLSDLIDQESYIIDNIDELEPLDFTPIVQTPKRTRKGLSLVQDSSSVDKLKAKPHIPWDRIDKSPENIKRIEALILEVIADFVAQNKKGQ